MQDTWGTTTNQARLDDFRHRFAKSTKHGAALLEYLIRSEASIWRFEEDRNVPGRWWLNITLPRHSADMFDLQREIQLLYTEHDRVEPRTLEVIQARIRRSLRVEPGLAIVASNDRKVYQLANRRRGELALVDINLANLSTTDDDVRTRLASVVSAVDHFDVTNPVRDPGGFYGRKDEIELLNHALNRGQSVGVFGLRKTGKTSLLNSIELHRREAGHPVAKVDLSEVASSEQFMMLLLERLRAAVLDSHPDLKSVKLRTLTESGSLKVSRADIDLTWLTDVQTILDASDERVELFIDEIDQAFPLRSELTTDVSSGLLRTLVQLRGLIQARDKLVLICAGVDPALFELPLLGNADNLLYKLVRLMWLGPLDKTETAEMVRSIGRRMGVRIRDFNVVDALYEEYGGHPLLTRKACSVAAGSRSRDEIPFTIDLESIRHVIHSTGMDSPLKQAQDIRDSFAEWFPDESELLHLLIEGNESSRAFARDVINDDASYLSHAVAYGLCYETLTPRIRAAFSDAL